MYHDLCFEEKYYNFSSESYYFYSCEKMLYIAYACFCNVLINKHTFHWQKEYFKGRGNGKRETR